jgi:hypothetical protein
MVGTLAQLVEHRTENPGVPSSILGGTTNFHFFIANSKQFLFISY